MLDLILDGWEVVGNLGFQPRNEVPCRGFGAGYGQGGFGGSNWGMGESSGYGTEFRSGFGGGYGHANGDGGRRRSRGSGECLSRGG